MGRPLEFESLMKRSLKDLERLADNLHSEFTRRQFATYTGRVKCCTCEKTFFWAEISCGHYMPRRHTATRWLIKNAGPQCGTCNGPGQGESIKMAAWLDLTYGPGTSEEMMILAHKNYKLDRVTLAEIIISLNSEIKKLS